MSNNPTLTAILDHPRVRALRQHTRYTGPDLARPEQMHELLGLADALSAFDVDITADCVPGPEHFSAAMYSVFEGVEGFKTHRAYGPTRTDALIAAIARALEVEK